MMGTCTRVHDHGPLLEMLVPYRDVAHTAQECAGNQASETRCFVPDCTQWVGHEPKLQHGAASFAVDNITKVVI